MIAPGGGFTYVASVHEGFPYAVEINKRGFNAFVLLYTGIADAVRFWAKHMGQPGRLQEGLK